MFSVLVLTVIGSGLALAKIERLQDRAPGIAELTWEHPHAVGDRYFTQEKLLSSLHEKQGQRDRRQSSSQPQQSGKFEFLDGYHYGLIHYSGSESEVIFVLTFNTDRYGYPTATNLYKSADYGRSFENIEAQLNPEEPDPLLWRSFYVSPGNLNMLVFASFETSRIYYTLNEGQLWDHHDFDPPTINPRSMKFSPTEDNWILAHDPTNERIYVSTNLGQSWKMIAENVDQSSDYQWDEPGWDSDGSVIYFNQFDPEDRDRGNYTVSLFTQRYPFGAETQQEFDPNLGRHEDFFLLGPYIFAQKTEDNDDTHLLVSYNRQPFQAAQIPTPYDHRSYIVSHIEERQALVIVQHEGGFYNLYLSEETGVYFSLSLRDLVVDYAIDLERIDGVNGTMIANQYVRDTPDVTDAPIRTLLTLDNGGNWELIHPPDLDVYGNPVNCEPPLCSLHFDMDTSAYARLGVFSTESAPGIIIAHGTLGDTLSSNPDLYISRDGGVTWHETLSGSYGANVLDHGGIIVAVNDYHQVSSTVLKYSCNEGLSWNSFTFTDSAMVIYGVITEPGEHTTNVSLYGIESSGSRNWVVVTVDFDPIFSRDCGDDDYYDWLPWDDRSDTDCILGSSIVIERRNITTCCRNGRDYVRETQYSICECNEEDFECDYGYAKPGEDLSGLCVKDPDVELEDPCDNEGTTTYIASTGYRKIAGDVCQGGDERLYAPYEAECCRTPTEPPTTATNTAPTTTTSSSTSSKWLSSETPTTTPTSSSGANSSPSSNGM
ncbi:Sortilin-related receptor [Geodia barretti]|uniref:Sortilin-related receptor n=1 Tax=Geodia barretti TaxID=519541 RepID=A0AA35SID4_GEOBA|nr:Sortilin-related receptor [Geodia barretti]